MPEQLTRHPEVTLNVLRSAGARCGEGVAQQILVKCPRERFCALPGGEICVYGLEEAGAMTQIGAADWQALAGSAAPAPPASDPGPPGLVVALIGLAVGALIALLAARRRRRP